MAASICVLSKPMASMLAIASARCSPMARALASPAPASAAAVRFGVGVAGAAAGALDVWAGAAGAAGVDVCAGAGVAGTAADEDASGAGAGLGSLGCIQSVSPNQRFAPSLPTHTLFTTQTTKPFSSILYDSTVSSSLRILPVTLSQITRGRRAWRPVTYQSR